MISLENVSLRYQSGPNILQRINLELPPGSFHFLTGPSGAGKTSLLKLIFLAHPPSAGRITVLGRDIATQSRKNRTLLRRQIGVVFQDYRLIDHLSVYDNITLPLRVAGQREAGYRDNALELLHWVGLARHVNALPPTLSGGEKQRAAIARAVMTRPPIIIADEPTGNVDAEMGLKLLRLLDALNQLGTTCLVATHDRHIWQQFNHPCLLLANHQLQKMTPAALAASAGGTPPLPAAARTISGDNR